MEAEYKQIWETLLPILRCTRCHCNNLALTKANFELESIRKFEDKYLPRQFELMEEDLKAMGGDYEGRREIEDELIGRKFKAEHVQIFLDKKLGKKKDSQKKDSQT